MAGAQSIKREKEGWLGVLLTALGCGAFLVWWFWPDDDTGILQATPENLLTAALRESESTGSNGALDEDLLVLALQAIETGDTSLAAKAKAAIADEKLRDLMERVAGSQSPETFDQQDSGTDALQSLLEEGKVDAGLEWAAALDDGPDRLEAIATIAGFLTQSGEIDRARALVAEHFASLPANAVSLRLRLASLYGQWGEFENAETAVVQAATAASTAAERLQVAKQCYSLNLFEAGALLMEQASKDAETDRALALEVANVYLEFGESEKARSVASRAAEIKENDAHNALLSLRLALAGLGENEFNHALTHWRKLTEDSIKMEAASAVREYLRGQMAATEAPPLIWRSAHPGQAADDVQSRALREAVDAGRPDRAAAEIAKWADPTARARGYIVLSRLLLWRHARAGLRTL